MITLAVMIVVAALGAMWLQKQFAADARESYISAEAGDLGLLATAVTKYVATPPATWVAKGTAYPILVTDLIAAGDLVSGFANRNGALGTTPFFQTYQILGELDPTDGKPRVVITDDGTISNARLQRVNASTTAAGILALKMAIAAETAQKYKLAAATMASGTSLATGVANAWTKGLGAWIPAASPGAAAVLIGYPDLTPAGTNTNPKDKWGHCQVVTVTNQGLEDAQTDYIGYLKTSCAAAAVCPAGMSELTRFPYCGSESYQVTPQYMVYPSDVGPITLGTDKQVTDTVALKTGATTSCDINNNCKTVYLYGSYDITQTDQLVLMGGAVVTRDSRCAVAGAVQGHHQNAGTSGLCVQLGGIGDPCVIQYNNKVPYATLTPGYAAPTSSMCNAPAAAPPGWTGGAYVPNGSLGPNATDVLCCSAN